MSGNNLRSLLKRDEIRRLLVKAMLGEVNEITPEVACYSHMYPTTDIEETTELLEKLYEVGILNREIQHVVLTCPYCSSSSININLVCPTCGSPKIEKGVVIEHMRCAYVDFEYRFISGDKLICPKCRKELKAIGIDYRKPTSYYYCHSCKNFNSIAAKNILCASCKKSFDENEGRITQIYAYRFNPDKKAEIERELIDFVSLVKGVESMNYKAVIYGSIRGESGVEHKVSLLITNQNHGAVAALDYAIEPELVSENKILQFLVMKIDTKLDKLILVAVPALTERARKLAEDYNITVIEAENAFEATHRVISELRQILVTAL